MLRGLPGIAPGRTALFVSGNGPAIETEVGLIAALRSRGFRVTTLSVPDPVVRGYHRLAGATKQLSWDDVLAPIGRTAAETELEHVRSFGEALRIVDDATLVGRHAASTALRALRVGTIDLRSAPVRERFRRQLRFSAAAARAAERLVAEVRPDLLVFNDRGYSPQAELFDRGIAEGVDVVTWNAAHRNNTLMLKRYHRGNRDDHPASLSSGSWDIVRALGWTRERAAAALEEIAGCYRSGEWYAEVGTQFGTRSVDRDAIRAALGLRPGVPCVAVFPHILWDGTFFWGDDLFESYEEWLVRTIEAARDNARADWVVKIHPANIIKNARDNVRGDPAELRVIRERIGALPDHVRIVPADSDISTYSLYSVVDHCVTVRGTVGIEAAANGIRTLTAGTGRFDRRGFTRDFASPQAYLDHLRSIGGPDPMTPSERELAERYAYGLFLLRPLRLSTMRLEYLRDGRATVHATIAQVADLRHAPDVESFGVWIDDRTREDYLSAPVS